MSPTERAVLEAMQYNLKELNSDVADAVGAVTETAASFEQLSEVIAALTTKLGELFDQQSEMNARINRYILDKARDDGRIGVLEKHVSEIRQRVG